MKHHHETPPTTNRPSQSGIQQISRTAPSTTHATPTIRKSPRCDMENNKNSYNFICNVGENLCMKFKLLHVGREFFSRKMFTRIESMQLQCIGRWFVNWCIIHAFIKTRMFSNFNFISFGIVPCDVLCSTFGESKECSFSRSWVEFCIGTNSAGRTEDENATCNEQTKSMGHPAN